MIKKEINQLARDAARYKFLRKGDIQGSYYLGNLFISRGTDSISDDEYDAQVDSEMFLTGHTVTEENNGKAMFVPLKSEYYEKIVTFEQNCEIRPCRHRGWSLKNIYPGRKILFSKGYGKFNRIELTIGIIKVTGNLKEAGIPKWHIDAVESIYGEREQWLIAFVHP